MSAQRRQLGRGLASLLGEGEPVADGGVTQGAGRTRAPVDLPVEFLRPGKFQPRTRFDPEPLDALAQSIRENGVLQPLIVRPVAGAAQSYEIIAGERRWRAAQLAQLDNVPVIIREMSDETALEVALVENLQRQDLSPLEEAEGYRRLMDEFAYTQDQLGKRLGKSRSHVANTLRLLALPEVVRSMIGSGALTAGHARTLVTADDPVTLAREIVEGGLSVRQAEARAQSAKSRTRDGGTADAAVRTGRGSGASADVDGAPRGASADTRALERDLEGRLGLKVVIQNAGSGEAGTITFHFKSFDQLDDLLEKLNR